MILLFLCLVTAADARPITSEWQAANRAIHQTCKGVNTPSELIVSYQSQYGVAEYSRLLADTVLKGLDSIRLQSEQDRLTVPVRIDEELLMLSQSILGSMLTIQRQVDVLDFLSMNLTWLQQTTEQSSYHNNKTKLLWHKLCRTQATRTSHVAWHTYEILIEELTKLQIMTTRVNAALTLTLASAT